jgi:hypothetical protein
LLRVEVAWGGQEMHIGEEVVTIIAARAGSPGLRLRARYWGDEWMAAASFHDEPGDLGAGPVYEFLERLNLGYIVSHGGTGSADGANGCRIEA